MTQPVLPGVVLIRQGMIEAKDIAATVDTIIRHGGFDTLDLPRRKWLGRTDFENWLSTCHLQAFSLISGLPYQNIEYILKILTADIVNRYLFIPANFMGMVVVSEDDERSLKHLCTEYEEMRQLPYTVEFSPLLHHVLIWWARDLRCVEFSD
jgi:hypothetical protein